MIFESCNEFNVTVHHTKLSYPVRMLVIYLVRNSCMCFLELGSINYHLLCLYGKQKLKHSFLCFMEQREYKGLDIRTEIYYITHFR